LKLIRDGTEAAPPRTAGLEDPADSYSLRKPLSAESEA